MKQSLFYPVIAGYSIGVFCASIFHVPLSIYLLSLVVVSFLIFACFSKGELYQDRELKQYSLLFGICIFLLVSILGCLRYELFVHDTGDSRLALFENKSIKLEGLVTEEPDERVNGVRLITTFDSIEDHGQLVKIKKTKIIVTDVPYSHINYGDQIEVEGILKKPQNFLGDNGKEFDYVSFLAKDKIFYQMQLPQITVAAHNKGNIIKEILLKVKHAVVTKLDEVIPFPESRLAAGLIVAGKRALPTDILNDFQKSGTLQVVVLSGYNMTIVAETLLFLFSFLPTLYSLIAAALGIFAFTIMAGGTATIVRSSIMALIAILAKLVRRTYNVDRALFASAFIMLLLNPMLLVFDPGFQLSFLSTIGLMYMSPVIKKYFIFITERFNLQATAVSTVATQIFVLPCILYLTGQVSLVALPANLLLFLFLPLTMLVCFIAAMLGFLFLPLATIIGYIAFGFLWYELGVVHFLGNLPFAFFTISSFPSWLLMFAYVGYCVVFYRFFKMKQQSRAIADKEKIKKF